MNRKYKLLILKIISLFSVIRGYNIPIIIIAQYLSAIFILNPEERALDILLDFNLFLMVFASAITIASGYIINNFYDAKKDLINRPHKTMLDRLVSQTTKLRVYFSLNFIAALMGLVVSWRACLFFSVYIFLVWLYSHKVKKHPFVGNFMAAILAIFPFFALLLYYYYRVPFEELENQKGHFVVIFAHAGFLFLLILIREMVKDLENIKGDLANNYQTIPIVYGITTSKTLISLLTLATIIPVYILIEMYDVGYMDLYFYFSFLVLLFFLLILWKAEKKSRFLMLHNLLKFLIVSGVFCIILINPSVLWHGKKVLLSCY
ncbi:geranylgeranylglycerol-phosphate geranylgeranyltransferase [Flavobacterium agrisoli]|nr:geranylgeranylglycerol-phosphate geranylgeranyltransferase [Flavobacterium agrisoli]